MRLRRLIPLSRPVTAGIVTAVMLLAIGAIAIAPAEAATPTETQIAAVLLGEINKSRAAAHVPALRRNAQLENSARAHDLTMSRSNVMSHQIPGEAAFGNRITAAGYRWRAAAENIGWNTEQTLHGILVLNNLMMHEGPPNDGHRVNLLNRAYLDIGISVYVDAVHHKIWLTEDFGTPA